MPSSIGRYRVQSLLGVGGMGSVYLAHDERLRRPVAIKLLAEDLARHPVQRERFVREAQAAAQISSPRVIAIHEVGDHDARPFIVMEFVEGTTLASRLAKRRYLAIDESVHILLQIALALDAAHAKGVLHRDIKPDNILIGHDGAVRVTDFGIAKVTDASILTRTGEVMGTATYMAPEQALGEPVDGRSDLYALGCVAYESITGNPPFESDNQVGLVYRHVSEPPVPMVRLRPEVPPFLDQIVLKLLAKPPADRYGSPRELADALERFQNSGRERPDPFPARDEPAPETHHAARFVGRGQELKDLQSALADTLRGRGSVHFVIGEAGVGKTRLLEELEAYAGRRGVRFLHGTCLYQEGAIPYLPFVAAIREYFRLARRDPDGLEREAVKEFLRRDAPELRAMIPQVGTEIGDRDDADPPARSQDPEQDRERLFERISQLLTRISEYRPLVLFLDDLQWADAASLKLLHYIASSCQDCPILLVGAYRAEEAEDPIGRDAHPLLEMSRRLGREGLSRTIHLSRLTHVEVKELLAHLLPGETIDPDLAERLFRETRGNALFVLELVALFRQDGTLIEKNGVWHLERLAGSGSIPARVRDVLARRVERLADDAREILECAAVVGDSFDAGLVSRILERRKIDLLRALQPLETRLRMIRCEADGFHFDHPKIQEVIYEGIPLEMKRELHRLVARELEKSDSVHPRKVFALARHYYEAGETSLAYAALKDASRHALLLHAYEEGECYLTRALEAYPASGAEAAEERELLILLAETRVTLGRWEEAEAAFQRALRSSRESDDHHTEARVLVGQGLAHCRQAHWEDATRCYEASVAAYEDLGEAQGLGSGYIGLGNIAFELGRWDEAEGRYHTAHRVGVESGVSDLVARACNNLGALSNVRGDGEKAVEWYERSLASFRGDGNELGAARALHNLGMSSLDRGDPETAEAHLRNSLAISTRMRQPDLMSITSLLIGDALLRRGCLPEARECCLHALAVFKRRDDRPGEADAYRILGAIFAAESRWEESENAFNTSLAINRECGQRLQSAETERAIGQMNLKRGQDDRARRHLERAMAEFRELGAEGAAQETEHDLEPIATT
jgi:tetratricopeptide (TPR) repeat protein/tRNA A-37 threonylcarbamoyl transferase component Bud32